jgi:hypothetical protein
MYITLNGINQLILLMDWRRVFFEAGTVCENIISASFMLL